MGKLLLIGDITDMNCYGCDMDATNLDGYSFTIPLCHRIVILQEAAKLGCVYCRDEGAPLVSVTHRDETLRHRLTPNRKVKGAICQVPGIWDSIWELMEMFTREQVGAL